MSMTVLLSLVAKKFLDTFFFLVSLCLRLFSYDDLNKNSDGCSNSTSPANIRRLSVV